MFELIQDTISKVYCSDITNEHAVEIIASISSEQLAEFIVDAFHCGWITRFNLGIDEDGEII